MARKLNTKLVAGVVIVAAAGGGALLVGPRLMKTSLPKLIALGDAAAAKGDWDAAEFNYGKAADRAGNDIDLQLKLVDAKEYTVRGDPERYRQIRGTLAQILTNDPRSVPALRRVLAYQLRDVKDSADTASVRSLTGTAERLLQLVDGDREARLALVEAVYEPYARNLEVKADDIDKQRDAAEKLWNEKPDDAEPLRIAVGFRLVTASHAIQNGEKDAAQDEVNKAQALVTAARQKSPDLAGVWMSAYDCDRLALGLAGTDVAKRTPLAKDIDLALNKADALAKPDDPSFLQIRSTVLHFMELSNPKAAEPRYRKLLDELPDDRQPRIMLAEFLARQPKRRDEALAVLTPDWKPSKPLRAMESRTQHIYQLVESVRKTAIGLEALDTVTDPDERKKRIAALDQQYKALGSDPEIAVLFKPALLRIAGGLQFAQGQFAQAIVTLDAALKLMNPDSPASFEQDSRNDALMAYAEAQLRLNQGGQARPALAELVDRRPENFAARFMLVNLLIAQRDVPAAKKQVQFLDQVLKGNPLVEQLKVRLLAMQGGDDLKTHYAELPETNRDERLVKLQAAATLSNADEVVRIAKLAVADNPADVQFVTTLAQAYAQTNHHDDAVAVVAAALKAKPDEKQFATLRDLLAAKDANARDALVQQQVDQMADPYARTLTKADLARQAGRPDDAIGLLKEAEKLKPDDARAYDAHFALALSTRRWPEAEAAEKQLIRLNGDQAGGKLYAVQRVSALAAAETDSDRRAALFKDALLQAQQAATQFRELASATLVYAKLLQQSGDFNSAVEQFGQTLDKNPTDRDALIGAANCLLALDRRTEAKSRIDAAAAQAADDPRVQELQLAYELRFGDPIKAVQTLQAQADKRPDDPQIAARLGLALEQVSGDRAKANDAAGAKDFLSKASDVYGRSASKFPQDLRFLAAYATTLRRLGQPAAAEQAVEKVYAVPANHERVDIGEMLAGQYIDSGKVDDAVRLLADLIDRVKPAPVSTVQRLALLLARQNRLNEAMQILDLRKDEPPVQRQRVELLLAANDLPAARQAVETALATHADPDTYLLAASVELRANDLPKAEGFVNKVFQDRPGDVTALFYRGQLKAAKQPADLDGARDDLIRARDLAPSSVEIRLTLANLYARRREPDLAQSELQKAWDINHQSKPALTQLVGAYAGQTPPQWVAVTKVLDEAKANPQLAADPDVLLLEADTDVARGDAKGAKAAAKAALAVDAKNAQLRQRYFDVLVRAKAYRDVLDESQPMLVETPDAWWLYRLRGMAQNGLGDKTAAQKELDAAFNLSVAANNPQAVEAVARTIAQVSGAPAAAAHVVPLVSTNAAYGMMAGAIYLEAADWSNAIAQFEPVVADAKNPAPLVRQTRQMLGSAYLQSNPPQAAKARPVFEALLKDTPDDVATLNNYACVLLLPDSGATPADALVQAKKAYDLATAIADPNLLATTTDTYGWAQVKAGQANDGIETLRRVADTARFPDVHLHLAEAYLGKNDLDDAEASLADAKRRFDDQTRRGQKVDPINQAKYAQLSADLTKKKAAAGG